MVTDRIRPLRIQGRELHLVGAPYHWGGAGLATGDSANDLLPIVLDGNVHINEYKVGHLRHPCRPPPARSGAAGARGRLPPAGGGEAVKLDVQTWPAAYAADAKPRKGFFTDTSLCIGCKACEVACKEWNHVPADSQGFTGKSYDNSLALGADRWRHVAFIEQKLPADAGGRRHAWSRRLSAARRCEAGVPVTAAGRHALADVLRRLQALHPRRLPGGLPDRRPVPDRVRHRRRPAGRLQRLRLLHPGLPVRGHRPPRGRRAGWKCTLCYDRLKDDRTPACAQACPTESIQFGDLEELRERAEPG